MPTIFIATDYSDESQPILPAYDGTQGDLSLTLPPGAATKSVFTNKLSPSDGKWFQEPQMDLCVV